MAILNRASAALDAACLSASAERSIIDAFRMRETEGYEAGNEALRRWLQRPGSQPGHLITMAAEFPKAHAAIRRGLEILL
ncbi:hypothetical protein [Flexivirga alba]|uniref:DUF222 domain-containing protein n=1 Tax=Flexivirga alba TaxID=702742 RepID=A0ABW2AJY4_9MICO